MVAGPETVSRRFDALIWARLCVFVAVGIAVSLLLVAEIAGWLAVALTAAGPGAIALSLAHVTRDAPGST
jgi:hypothetical protein